MSYNKSPFKMAPKSPLTKALKGNQGKLPQHLQEAIKAGPESPAKAMTGPGVQKEAGKTGTGGANSAAGKNAAPAPVQGPPRKTSGTLNKSLNSRSYAPGTPEGKAQAKFDTGNKPASSGNKTGTSGSKASGSKPKYDKELNTLVAARKGLKKGTSEYNTIQNQINAKLGSKKVHGRGTSTTTDLKSKEVRVVPKQEATTPKPAAQKPAAQKPAASKGPSQADKFENVLAKENAKAPMGSETGSKAPAKKPAAKQPVVAKKPVAKKPVAKKTVGQKVKGTVKKARLAQLDKKANRQEARVENKTARKTKRAEKLTARANKLTGK
jgi:hypothetical protein